MKKIIAFLICGVLLVVLFAESSIFVFESAQASELADNERKKKELEAELYQLELDIAEKQKLLYTQKTQTGSIQNEIDILTTKIDATKLGIKKKQLLIDDLSSNISSKEKNISSIAKEIERELDSLAQLVRLTDEADSRTFIEMVLGGQSISNFYNNLDSYVVLRKSIQESVVNLGHNKNAEESERVELIEYQKDALDEKVSLESDRRKVEKTEDEKKALLTASKSVENQYQALINERQTRAAEIRRALFALRDTAAIPFGDALAFAKTASNATGVRPALILAILQQESNLGENIGSCYLTNPATGEGKGKNTGRYFAKVMKATRDVAPFLDVTSRLGLDPYSTPVSCPWSGGGYGGAMGPSQFIPSTWILFENRIANAVGASIADPWIPQHAILATALYMSDLGAGAGGYTAERNAACRYYSGQSCGATAVENIFYGDGVMAKAQNIQENMIDLLDNI